MASLQGKDEILIDQQRDVVIVFWAEALQVGYATIVKVYTASNSETLSSYWQHTDIKPTTAILFPI
jgi:methionyl-tRNA synthetase